MDLRFPSVFSEFETMWTDADCGLPSLALQDGKGWARDLQFPFVFSEDKIMRIVIVGPPGWQRMGDGSFLPLCLL